MIGKNHLNRYFPMLLLLLYASCTCEPEPTRRVNTLLMRHGEIVHADTTTVSKKTVYMGPYPEKTSGDPIAQPPAKMHPLLQAWLKIPEDSTQWQEPPDQTATLVITFRDTLQLPRFPVLAIDEPHDSRKNRRALTRAQELIEVITARRAQHYQDLTDSLANYEAEVVQTFWLINGMVVRMPLIRELVEGLAEREEVLSIVPQHPGERPPSTGAPQMTLHYVADGRRSIRSDPYFRYTGGKIGLLDSGIRFDHIQFKPATHIGLKRDCTEHPCCKDGASCDPGDIPDCSTCSGLDPTEACSKTHGTSTAAILTANTQQGDQYRGVTDLTLDSFKIFTCIDNEQIKEEDAAILGFQAAVAALDGVILTQIEGDASKISIEADNAFETGAVVIAAIGKDPCPGPVPSPANAHKAISAGAFDIGPRTTHNAQRCGPTLDGRIKPDIQGPTGTITAGAESDEDKNQFLGTSGAAPYVAGAAALLRNWLIERSGLPCGPDEKPCIDPGQVYAQLLLAGTYGNFSTTSAPDDSTRGVGPLWLPPLNGKFWLADSEYVVDSGETGESIEISLPLSDYVKADTLAAALWWPEDYDQCHNDVDLYLLDPDDTVQAESKTMSSVFERVQETETAISGNWKLHLVGQRVGQVPSGETCEAQSPQKVYWAAAAWPISTLVFVNEIHYDNAGTDIDEAIEIAGPAGTSLENWRLILYNGGHTYGTINLSGTIPNDCNGFGVRSFPRSGLQNGTADGVALVDDSDNVIQFLSYEGSFTATEGPASGATSIDIGVSESNSTPNGRSLQLVGAGTTYEDFTWNADVRASFGTCNEEQTFGVGSVVINEIDVDTPGTDNAEFVEIFGAPNSSLDGLVIVFYNGYSDRSYEAFDLDGFTTDNSGFFVLGNAAVPNVDLVFSDDLLQNGADAVALYLGNASDFPNGTPVKATNLIDALVYDTNDADDTDLLNKLTPGATQIDEDGAGNKDSHSNARVPNGGQALNTATYVQQAPTPGTTNG